MAEGQWYYAKDGSQQGPVSEAHLRALLEAGELRQDTLVWSEGMTGWSPASEQEPFRPKAEPTPPPLPDSPSPEARRNTETDTQWARGPQVRPWSRWFARITDYSIANLVIGLALGVLLGLGVPVSSLLHLNRIVQGVVVIFLWMFPEAFLLSAWGTTPGKWLLGIRVRSSDGEKPTLASALRRSYWVWIGGVALGVPLVNLFTLYGAYRDLRTNGATDWDLHGGFVVSHRPIGVVRVLLLIALWVGFFCLLGLKQTA